MSALVTRIGCCCSFGQPNEQSSNLRAKRSPLYIAHQCNTDSNRREHLLLFAGFHLKVRRWRQIEQIAKRGDRVADKLWWTRGHPKRPKGRGGNHELGVQSADQRVDQRQPLTLLLRRPKHRFARSARLVMLALRYSSSSSSSSGGEDNNNKWRLVN